MTPTPEQLEQALREMLLKLSAVDLELEQAQQLVLESQRAVLAVHRGLEALLPPEEPSTAWREQL